MENNNNQYNLYDDLLNSLNKSREKNISSEPPFIEEKQNIEPEVVTNDYVEIEDLKFDEIEKSFNEEVNSNIKEETIEFDFDFLKNQKIEETKEEKNDVEVDIEKEFNKKYKEILLEEEQAETKKEPKSKKEKQKKEKKKKEKTLLKTTIFFIFCDVMAIVCLFLMYGPISYFRDLWITSAMETMNHKYLAYIFFDQETIDKCLSKNKTNEAEGETIEEEIKIQEEEIVTYENEFEEAVLKKDEGNDLYKVFEVSGDGYVGHMLVIYDPSKIHLRQIKNKHAGKTIDQLAKENNAIAGINGTGFSYSSSRGYTPVGALIIDGKIINSGGAVRGYGGGIIGFTYNNILVLTKSSAEMAVQSGIRDAISFGPFLVVNGVPATFQGNGGYGIAPRTAIGQRKDGIVLFLVIDGRRAGHSLGVDMKELTDIMVKYGAYNASNLDGGGSSTMYVNGEILSVSGGFGYSGERYLPNAWLLIDE